VTRKVLIEPHPDDNMLSMGLATYDAAVLGYEVHIVAMTNGKITPQSIKLDGSGICNWCNYVHQPALEGYMVPTSDQMAQLRLEEGRNTAIQLAAAAGNGSITYHDGTMDDDPLPLDADFGYNSPTAVADAQEIIKHYVDKWSNTFFYTMSYKDKHADHAACGQALKNLRESNEVCTWGGGLTYAQALVNSRFFISRLYWNDPTIVLNGVPQVPGLAWYNAGDRYDADCAALRRVGQRIYSAWDPSKGSFGIGFHQVVNQFLNNFGTGVSIGNKMHA
jgi:LmbE family N-acetylglucosaminyl deacetylase